jgi:hypothetical protein
MFWQRLSVSWEDWLALAEPNQTAGQLSEACPDRRLQIEDFADSLESYQIHLKSFLATTLRVSPLHTQALMIRLSLMCTSYISCAVLTGR